MNEADFIAGHDKLISVIASRYFHSLPYHDYFDIEDAQSEARLAVLCELRKGRTFDEVRQRLGWVIKYSIRRMIWCGMQLGDIHNRAPSDRGYIDLAAVAEVVPVEMDTTRLDAARFYARLQKQQRQILAGRLAGYNSREICSAVGVDQWRYYYLVRRIREAAKQ